MGMLVIIIVVVVYCLAHLAVGVGIDDCITEWKRKNIFVADILYRLMRIVGVICILMGLYLWFIGLRIGARVFKQICLLIFYNKNDRNSNLPYY